MEIFGGPRWSPGSSNNVTGEINVVSSPSVMLIAASRFCVLVARAAALHLKPMNRRPRSPRTFCRSSGQSASSNVSALRIPAANPQAIDGDRCLRVEGRQPRARQRVHQPHVPDDARLRGAVRPSRVALRVCGPVLIANAGAIDLQADRASATARCRTRSQTAPRRCAVFAACARARPRSTGRATGIASTPARARGASPARRGSRRPIRVSYRWIMGRV